MEMMIFMKKLMVDQEQKSKRESQLEAKKIQRWEIKRKRQKKGDHS